VLIVNGDGQCSRGRGRIRRLSEGRRESRGRWMSRGWSLAGARPFDVRSARVRRAAANHIPAARGMKRAAHRQARRWRRYSPARPPSTTKKTV
jgi:hypothetical protein